MVNTGLAAQILNTPTGRLLPLLVNPFWANLDPKILVMPKDYFIYGTDYLPLAANARVRNTIQIQADSHYLIMGVRGRVTETDDETLPTGATPILMQFFDSGSGREIQNHQVHWDNFFGTAQLSGYMDFPKIMKAQSTLSLELQNLSATPWNVRVDFTGFKLFLGKGYAEPL